jgi:hypothetical protein
LIKASHKASPDSGKGESGKEFVAIFNPVEMETMVA